MTHTPDRIWATGNGSMGSWNSTQVNPSAAPPQTEYLRATPAREAADDLLEALEPFASATIMTDGSIVGMERWFFEQARAAIAKAKGIN